MVFRGWIDPKAVTFLDLLVPDTFLSPHLFFADHALTRHMSRRYEAQDSTYTA